MVSIPGRPPGQLIWGYRRSPRRSKVLRRKAATGSGCARQRALGEQASSVPAKDLEGQEEKAFDATPREAFSGMMRLLFLRLPWEETALFFGCIKLKTPGVTRSAPRFFMIEE